MWYNIIILQNKRRIKMIKLKKLIAIAVLAAMLSNGAMPSSGTTAQGDRR